jgi:hypothetical protein
LSRATTIQINLDFVTSDGDARRTSIEHNADTPAVRFSPSGNAKDATERVPCAHGECEGRRCWCGGKDAYEGCKRELHCCCCVLLFFVYSCANALLKESN